MFKMELGHNPGARIITYGDKSQLPKNLTSSLDAKYVEPVALEGDIPDYFHTLCNPNVQTKVREVFAPDSMVRFIDFCRAYDLELLHETLFVPVAEGVRPMRPIQQR